MLNVLTTLNCWDNTQLIRQSLSKHKSFLIMRVIALTILVIATIFYSGCSTEPTKSVQAPTDTNFPKKDSAPSPSATPPTSELKEIRLEGSIRDQFDSIVMQIGAKNAGKMLASTIGILSEGHQRPSKTAKVRSTIGDFSGRDTIKSGKGDCTIAVSGGEVEIEAAGDGSKAKMISVPTGSVAKVYGDFALSNGIVILKGTMLRRQAEGWVSFKDIEYTGT